MRLAKVHVTNFRSVEDSGGFDVGQVLALVGLDAVIAAIADDVFADSSVKKSFAVFRSRIRRIENSLLKAGIPSDRVNDFYRESFAIFDCQNPKLVKRYMGNDNIVPRQNGRR